MTNQLFLGRSAELQMLEQAVFCRCRRQPWRMPFDLRSPWHWQDLSDRSTDH